jgi:NTP pyrophosphatase (non-canonical NTP hydrolase)
VAEDSAKLVRASMVRGVEVDGMTLNAYQRQAAVTAKYNPKIGIIYPVLGLAGETGEFVEKVKKWLRDDKPDSPTDQMGDARRIEAGKELGDILWYLSDVARHLGFTLEEIATMNIRKLRDRQDRGTIHGEGDNR